MKQVLSLQRGTCHDGACAWQVRGGCYIPYLNLSPLLEGTTPLCVSRTTVKGNAGVAEDHWKLLKAQAEERSRKRFLVEEIQE